MYINSLCLASNFFFAKKNSSTVNHVHKSITFQSCAYPSKNKSTNSRYYFSFFVPPKKKRNTSIHHHQSKKKGETIYKWNMKKTYYRNHRPVTRVQYIFVCKYYILWHSTRSVNHKCNVAELVCILWCVRVSYKNQLTLFR